MMMMMMNDDVTEQRFCLAGHVLRLLNNCPVRVAMIWTPVDGKWKIGRPKMTCRKTFDQDLAGLNISREEAVDIATNRWQWRKAAAQCAEMHGRN